LQYRTPAEIAKKMIEVGKAKAKLGIAPMLLLAVMAGLFIGLSAAGASTAMSTVGSPSMARFASAAVFPCGLVMILVAGAELFTGNCLMTVPLLQKEIGIGGMLRNWLFVYIGNFIGSLLAAVIVVYGSQLEVLGESLVITTVKIAVNKLNYGFGEAVLMGIGCNVLVCIAVWIAFAADRPVAKIVGLYLPVMMFVLAGFEHCVANMYYIPAGLLAIADPAYAEIAVNAGLDLSGLTWGGFLLKNLLPVTIGNILGGSVVVGMTYWFCYLRSAAQPQKVQDKLQG